MGNVNMKKYLSFLITICLLILPSFAKVDKTSEDYLKSKNHISAINPFVEHMISNAIKQSLKKEFKGRYKVKFTGYTLSSIKAGVFKYMEITGHNVVINDISIPYVNFKTLSDYNRINYNQKPIVIESDIELDYIMKLSEESVNSALKSEEYMKVLRKINKRVFPLFTINEVNIKIKDEIIYIVMSYNFPLSPKEKDRTFMVSSKLKVLNNEIRTYDVAFNERYGNLPLDKVTNLVNLINPLNFTLKLIDEKNCDCKIEDIKIEDDIIAVNGKMYIKGEKINER